MVEFCDEPIEITYLTQSNKLHPQRHFTWRLGFQDGSGSFRVAGAWRVRDRSSAGREIGHRREIGRGSIDIARGR